MCVGRYAQRWEHWKCNPLKSTNLFDWYRVWVYIHACAHIWVYHFNTVHIFLKQNSLRERLCVFTFACCCIHATQINDKRKWCKREREQASQASERTMKTIIIITIIFEAGWIVLGWMHRIEYIHLYFVVYSAREERYSSRFRSDREQQQALYLVARERQWWTIWAQANVVCNAHTKNI